MGDAESRAKSGGAGPEQGLPCEAKSMQSVLTRMAHELNNAANQLILSRGLLEDVCRDMVPVLKQCARENGEFMLGGLSSGDVGSELPQLLESMRGSVERIERVAAELRRLGQDATSVSEDEGGKGTVVKGLT